MTRSRVTIAGIVVGAVLMVVLYDVSSSHTQMPPLNIFLNVRVDNAPGTHGPSLILRDSLSPAPTQALERPPQTTLHTPPASQAPRRSEPTRRPALSGTKLHGFDARCRANLSEGVRPVKNRSTAVAPFDNFRPTILLGSYDFKKSFGLEQCIERCQRNPACRVVCVFEDRQCHLYERAVSLLKGAGGFTSYIMQGRPNWVVTDPGILFLVLTTKKYAWTRMAPVLRTWLADQQSYMYFEADEESRRVAAELVAAFPNVRTKAVFVQPPPNFSTFEFVEPGQKGSYKNLAAMKHILAEDKSNVPWYMFVDDDTFVIQSSLRAIVNDYAPKCCNTPCLISRTITPGILRPELTPNMSSFAFGGPGMLINRAAMWSLTESRIDKCIRYFTENLAGDIAVSRCLNMFTGLQVTREERFHLRSSVHYILTSLRDLEFIATFHRMTNTSMVLSTHDCAVAITKNMTSEFGPPNRDSLHKCLRRDRRIDWRYFNSVDRNDQLIL